MAVLLRILTWISGAVSLARPFLAALFGLGAYAAAGGAVYGLISSTNHVVSAVQATLTSYGNDLASYVQSFWTEFSGNDWLNFLVYAMALDEPLNWVSSFLADLVSFYFFWAFSIFVYGVEAALVVVGFIWCRSRLKAIVAGLSGDGV